MEIADIFVVNKADRPNADLFVKNLQLMSGHVPVLKTIASENKGIDELTSAIREIEAKHLENDHKYWLLTERAYQLIAKKGMEGVSREELMEKIRDLSKRGKFNLYEFVSHFTSQS